MRAPHASGRRPPSGAVAAVAVAATALAALALAQGLPTVTVERSDRTIVVEQRTTGADGARTVLANRNCEDGVLTNLFFGPVPGYVVTRFDDTELTSQLAIVRVPQRAAANREGAADDAGGAAAAEDAAEAPGADAADAADDETIELLGGRATFDRPGCLEVVDPEGARPVELLQGRTTVRGRRFFLDRGTDVATMDGPIELTRRAEGAGPEVRATADALQFDVADERATLTGAVTVTSGDRVSSADRLELDEEAGVAILSGSPAVSRRGADEVRGDVLRYDLETDDVVVVGNVSATFEVDLGGDEGGAVDDGGDGAGADGGAPPANGTPTAP
jgi:lipopolysaccharide export system protein LptA